MYLNNIFTNKYSLCFWKKVTEQKVKFPMKFLTFFEVQKENNYLLFIFAFTNYIIHTLCNS